MEQSKWVFVTGGARGIGAGLVRMLVKEGYSVAFTYLSSASTAEALAAECHTADTWCRGFQCDMTDHAAVNALAALLCAEYGSPYALINNAGITRDASLFVMDATRWHEVIRNNLDSVYHTSHALLPHLAENGDACIINISSVTGIKGNPGQSNYAATKAAMIGMTKSMAVELGRFNVRVNVIAPGIIETEMTAGLNDQQLKKLRDLVPLKKLGSTEDIARMVVFLLGQGGRYITGQTFVIDGGMTA